MKKIAHLSNVYYLCGFKTNNSIPFLAYQQRWDITGIINIIIYQMKKSIIFTLFAAMLATLPAMAMPLRNADRVAKSKLHLLSSVPTADTPTPAADEVFMQLTPLSNGPRKAGINGISDLYGTWMVNYSSWDFSNYTQDFFTVTIKRGLTNNQIVISGWWVGSLANDIKATVSMSGGSGTITIAPQLCINVDGYSPANLVNYDNPSGNITGTIYSGGIRLNGKWALETTDGSGYYAIGTGTLMKKTNGKMAYTFEGETYYEDVLMGQTGITHEGGLAIYNFFGLGTYINDPQIEMRADSTFEIQPQLLYTDPDTGANYYCYGTDGTTRWNITGHGNENRLTFDTPWSLCSPSTDEWMGSITDTYLYYTDGSTFKFPAVAPTGITLNVTDADEAVVEPGATLQLLATVTPAGANQSVTWTSSDESVATVDANGLVTAKQLPAGAPARTPKLKDGYKTVTITATSTVDTTLSASVLLYVGEPDNGVYGDLNGDGLVDTIDLNLIINSILGRYETPIGDLNNDGLIDTIDMNIIINIILGRYDKN